MSHAITCVRLQTACALPQECAGSIEVDLWDDVKQNRVGGVCSAAGRAGGGEERRGGEPGKRT